VVTALAAQEQAALALKKYDEDKWADPKRNEDPRFQHSQYKLLQRIICGCGSIPSTLVGEVPGEHFIDVLLEKLRCPVVFQLDYRLHCVPTVEAVVGLARCEFSRINLDDFGKTGL